jgi:hypothetical protein
LDKCGVFDNHGHGMAGADSGTAAAAPALALVNDRAAVFDMDGLYKACTVCANAAAGAVIVDFHLNARHAGYFPADIRVHVWQRLPETAAGAAVADGHEFAGRADI